MTRIRQKNEERIYAERAAELLQENWRILVSCIETAGPDLVIEKDGNTFGLEVREVFGDESPKGGSKKKAAESNHEKYMRQVANLYYARGAPPVYMSLTDMPNQRPEQLAQVLFRKVSLLEVDGETSVRLGSGKTMFLQRLPTRAEFENYRRWPVYSDAVGWRGTMNNDIVQKAIDNKEQKLDRYRQRLNDIRLMIVCDRTRNSGKYQFDNIDNLQCKGFESVYLMSFPESVKVIPKPATRK